MNNIAQKALFVALFISSNLHAYVLPYIAFRSQGFNAARELVGWQTQINKSCEEDIYGSFSITPEFTRSFKSDKLAKCLFADALTCNSCNKSVIKIQGTKVQNRDSKALMAENFYLPTDFQSELRIAPRIENFLVDLNFYLGLDKYLEGLYVRIHTPICYTRYDLNMCEHVIDSGSLPYDAGYFNNSFTPATSFDLSYGLSRDHMLSSFTEYVCQGASIADAGGITYQGLNRARMSTKTLTKTRPAELTAALGWNFWTGDGYHFGLNIRAAAPTGNKPRGCWLFEPIVGNGHHWELGAGLTGHWRWWQNEAEDKEFSTYIDANITTLFSSRQERTFDLCGKPLSRYMLALKFTHTANNLLSDTETGPLPPLAQFANEFVPVANLTTIPVDVSVPLHIDAALKCTYLHCNWQFDLGYDFWYRACEKICNRFECCKNGFTNYTYALKGDTFVYGFAGTEENTILANQPGIALSASEHNATIFGGTNNYGQNPNFWSGNFGIDLATYPGGGQHYASSNNFPAGESDVLYTHNVGSAVETAFTTSVNTSYNQPIYFNECDFNTDGAKNSGLSNKVFAHVGYTWNQCECLTPYFGVGGEAEFGLCDKFHSCSSTKNGCHKNCSCCKQCSLSQWGIWLKGGLSF
jgi:hypothetical protein